jgi:type IV pilus assembly protein PilE
MKTKNQDGFTLIEMMIVIAIIAVLTAIAVPNYQSYMSRTVCEDAKGVLAGAAGTMERFRAQNNTYMGVALAEYAQSPVDGNAQFNIAANPITASTYTLTATPVVGGRLAGRGTLTLTSTGVRAATGDLANPTGAAAPVSVWDNSCRGL